MKKLGNAIQINSIKRLAYTDGPEKGLEILSVSNGVLDFEILPDFCLDLGQLRHKGANISFISKNGFVARRAPYMKKFCGGMLYTCGLDSIGQREGFEVHGSIHGTPARISEIFCDDNKIRVTGTMTDSALFGKNIKLTRTIETQFSSGAVDICDEVQNAGFADEDYCLLYHINIGFPMLDAGANIYADAISSRGRTKFAQENIKDCFNISEPVDAEEQVFYHVLKSGRVTVENPIIKKRFSLTYNAAALPHFVEWKSMIAGDYALGLEPSTSLFDDEFKYSQIKAGETKTYKLRLEVGDI
jgi:hypothetical protein